MLKGGAGHADTGYGRASFEQERICDVNSSQNSPSANPRHASLLQREQSPWRVRSPRATEVRHAALVDLAGGGSPVKLKAQSLSSSGSTSARGCSSPARWRQAPAGALSPIPILQGSSSVASSPTPPPRHLSSSRDGSSANGSSRLAGDEAGADVLQHATLQQQQQQQQQQAGAGAGDNSPRPHQYSSLGARLANNPSYQNLPLDVASLDGHTQSCDTPDSNCSAHSTGSVMLESPHQPATTRFKPRPPGSSSGSASSAPHSSTPAIAAAGSSGSVTSIASVASAGGASGAASSLQPHPPPPQSVRKASKPLSAGAVASLPEVGSPHVSGPLHSMGSFTAGPERCSDSPVPGSSTGAGGSSDQGGSGVVPFRRSNYRLSLAAADLPGSSGNKPVPLFSPAFRHSLMGLSSAGTELGSNPNNKTPLHEAVSLGYVSMVRMLLAAGSDPNLGPEKQGGPLLQAAGVGASEIVQLLLGAGARVDATDAQGRTALHHACGGGHVEVARLLISRGAALTARTLDGETPLDLARPAVQLALCCGPDERSPTAAQAEAARSSQLASTAQQQQQQQQQQGGSAHAAAAAAAAAVSGGSSAGSRWGSRVASALSSETGEHASSAPLDQLPEERAPTPPSMDLQMGDMEWTCGRLLGEGAYGKVFEGLNKRTGELMAVKALTLLGRPDSEAVRNQLQELTQELHMYKQLKHAHIVGYIDARFDTSTNTLYIFLENVPGGSIASMLQRFGGPFPENVARNYTRQLLLGLEYLHSQLIVHRDVKGGNALLTTSGIVKLADFGASKIHKAGDGGSSSSGSAEGGDACRSVLAQSLRGSACWMAPEVVRGQGYGRKADIWSLGCTVLEMLSGKHPWPDIDNQFAVMLAIHNATQGPPRPPGLSPLANDFLDHCFRMNPNDRSSAEQLLTHAWVAGQGSNPTRTRASLSQEV
ncbi:hypothetical protein OEZ86_001224 [Tetradesmus obliquus]|nr:hypothetical protein OEZ86_001224 [Tetradesmus obliquus]